MYDIVSFHEKHNQCESFQGTADAVGPSSKGLYPTNGQCCLVSKFNASNSRKQVLQRVRPPGVSNLQMYNVVIYNDVYFTFELL
jgi:hypothetical protein